MTQILDRNGLRAALEWQVELGADEAFDESFVNRMSALRPAPRAGEEPVKAPALIPSTDASADRCETLDALRIALAEHPHPLKESARNCVFADGNPAAHVMIIGEAPGRDEDAQGLPFVGKSGQLLDRMLDCIGLNRHSEDPASAVYIANILPWRPPSNRTPSIAEAAEFKPFIARHIELADPKLLVTMGNVSTKTMLETTTGIMRMRGEWTEIAAGGKARPVLPMLHPAYLLRQPADKSRAWADLLSLQDRLEASI